MSLHWRSVILRAQHVVISLTRVASQSVVVHKLGMSLRRHRCAEGFTEEFETDSARDFGDGALSNAHAVASPPRTNERTNETTTPENTVGCVGFRAACVDSRGPQPPRRASRGVLSKADCGLNWGKRCNSQRLARGLTSPPPAARVRAGQDTCLPT